MYSNEYANPSHYMCKSDGSRKLQMVTVMFVLSVVMIMLSIFLAFFTLNRGERESKLPTLLDQSQSGPQQDAESKVSAAPVSTTKDWKLLLVNPWNILPEDYSIETVTLGNGERVDARCYPDLQAMMDGCRAAGNSPVICSAYRTWEAQNELFQNQVDDLLAQGYSEEEAKTEAEKVVAVPGTSEHQLGLAMDIVDINNQNLDESQESTDVQRWLMEHSWEYGFILRYPNGKSSITGIIYEPWHYRYVGKEAAKKIYTRGICLEEYVQSRN